jgi:CheY-like chemotaxis protein
MVTEARPTGGHNPLPPPFTVVVADDDRGTREALAEFLQNQGFRPVLAADGGEAVEIVQV